MILTGDSLQMLKIYPDDYFDSCVTDPPYGLKFMGNRWDCDVPSVELWAEVLRVLKPGGYLLAFAGTRTQHRMASRIEDAGFEIRDMLLDLLAADAHIGPFLNSLTDAQQRAFARCIDESQFGGLLAWVYGQGFPKHQSALKPALEPITLARKPAPRATPLRIDDCRVPIDLDADASQLRTMSVSQHDGADGWGMNTTGANPAARVLGVEGRYPANLVHDGSPEVLAEFPDAPGQQGRASDSKEPRQGIVYGARTSGSNGQSPRGDSGSASRFFYCAKASRKERGEDNKHPTVKPVELMRWLCRLVTPIGGQVLDPFAGSGTTGIAAALEGLEFTGIERDPEYAELARGRIDKWQ